VFGGGSQDLVVINGPASHLEVLWEEPGTARCFQRLGSFARVVLFDRRGTGLSDSVTQPPTLEQQMDDLIAVLDAVGIERTALWGASDLGLSALFAATYPERITALVLSSVSPRGPASMRPELRQQFVDAIENHWGEGTLLSIFAPSQVGNRAFAQWWGRMQRSAVSPGMARQLMDMIAQTDLTAVLPTIRLPTLVTHETYDRYIPVEAGREVAALIPSARFIEYPGEDTLRVGRGVGAGRCGGVPHRAPARAPGDRPRAGDGDVHGHRRFHRPRRPAGRRPLARAAGRAQHARAKPAPALAGDGDQIDRRRVPGHVRRTGAGRPVRVGDRRPGR
jgi:pimeloyl-ACP methyl ester carboxylesterase